MSAGKLNIKLQDLMMALDGHGPAVGWFLDRVTGSVAYATREQFAPEHPDYFDPGAHPDRYLRIDPISADEARDDIARFIDGLGDESTRANLSAALSASQPFQAFKEAVRAFPDIADDWQHEHETKIVGIAMQWLEDQRIPAELS